ncbi:MAG: VacJ family lipoprotein [Lysobacteraceae bacterium]|nr:MAG: VacJ family lipoprotein [Xanthomonadaceae bacterium]
MSVGGCAHRNIHQAPLDEADTPIVSATKAETAPDPAPAISVDADTAHVSPQSIAEPTTTTAPADDLAVDNSAVDDSTGATNAQSEATTGDDTFAAHNGASTEEPDTYNPVADANLPAPAAMPASFDPWEKFNRRVHRFNNAVDRRIAKPLATAYTTVVPRPMRLGVSNFFNNLGQPVSALNALLQGKPKQAGQSMGRFLLNSTLGIGGLFDPATAAKIPLKSEDFGQTLGVWGWKKSRYIELPLFGPRTIRDTLGLFGDAPLSPIRPIEKDKVRVLLQGLQLVDVRSRLLSVDSLREGATDDYSLVRDAWLQRRDYQIQGDRNSDETLPDYLLDEDNPTVPVDAMPVIPGTP